MTDKSAGEQLSKMNMAEDSTLHQNLKALVEPVPDVESVMQEHPSSHIDKQIKLTRLKAIA